MNVNEKLKKLQERLRALMTEGDALEAKEQRTDEEEKRFGEIQSEMAEVEPEIESLQRRIRADDSYRERRDAANRFSGRPIEDGSEDEPLTEDRGQYSRWPVEEAGQWFRAVQALSMGGSRLPSDMNEELRETFIGAMEQRAPTGQGTIVEGEGGWAVPMTVASEILRIIHQDGQILSRVRNVPITVGNATKWNALNETDRGNTGSGGRYGGITVARTAEAGALAASTAHMKQVALELKKLTAGVYFTEEQLTDGPQVMSVVNSLVPSAFTFAIENELVNGTGGPNIHGVLNSNCLVTVAKETGQSAATILYENIVKMWNRLHGPSRSNSAWFIEPDLEPQLHQMFLAVGTGGVPVYLPANGVAGSPFGTLMGRPVIPIEHCAALGTVGDIILADFSQFLYATKGGMLTQQSIHVRFLQGETVMRFMLRNDGKPWWSAPLTSTNDTTRSPFVVLATRS